MVDLTQDAWSSFVWELKSCFALLYGDELAVTQGSFGQLARWESPLRVAFDGQVTYDIDDPPPVLDADGAPLDCRGRSRWTSHRR